MSQFIKQFKGFVAKNPEFKAVLQGLARDGVALQTMPIKLAGDVRRAYGHVVENVADIAGDAAGKVAEYAPRVQVGPEDAPITMHGQLGRGAKIVEGVAGLAEKGGEFLSDYESPAEQLRESALGAMDRRIEETMGEGLPSQREIFLKRKAEVEARKGKAGADEEEFDPPSWESLSPEEQEAHRERKRQRIRKRKRQERRDRRPAEEFDLEATGYPMGDEAAEEGLDEFGGGDPTGEEYDTAFDDELPEGMEDAVSSDVDVSGAAKAVPVAPDDQAESLFRTVHGGPFDPKSRMDRGKLAKIKENLVREEYQGLTPNQFALKMYREAA